MPSPTEITVSQLSRQVGLPSAPAVVDVRIEEDFTADPRLIPGARRHPFDAVDQWAPRYRDRKVVVACQRGKKLSQGVVALLRNDGIAAEGLEGGTVAWAEAGEPTVAATKIPPRDQRGRTVWVTRARPKIDRTACPWLITRFVDPGAAFLFVAPAEVAAVAVKFNATPFDVDGAFWSHRDAKCSFDTMIEEFGLTTAPLQHMADIIRAADTDVLNPAPQAAGLSAIILGQSRMHRDDLTQLDAALHTYDALYRWCRDATEETHGGPTHP